MAAFGGRLVEEQPHVVRVVRVVAVVVHLDVRGRQVPRSRGRWRPRGRRRAAPSCGSVPPREAVDPATRQDPGHRDRRQRDWAHGDVSQHREEHDLAGGRPEQQPGGAAPPCHEERRAHQREDRGRGAHLVADLGQHRRNPPGGDNRRVSWNEMPSNCFPRITSASRPSWSLGLRGTPRPERAHPHVAVLGQSRHDDERRDQRRRARACASGARRARTARRPAGCRRRSDAPRMPGWPPPPRRRAIAAACRVPPEQASTVAAVRPQSSV